MLRVIKSNKTPQDGQPTNGCPFLIDVRLEGLRANQFLIHTCLERVARGTETNNKQRAIPACV